MMMLMHTAVLSLVWWGEEVGIAAHGRWQEVMEDVHHVAQSVISLVLHVVYWVDEHRLKIRIVTYYCLGTIPAALIIYLPFITDFNATQEWVPGTFPLLWLVIRARQLSGSAEDHFPDM